MRGVDCVGKGADFPLFAVPGFFAGLELHQGAQCFQLNQVLIAVDLGVAAEIDVGQIEPLSVPQVQSGVFRPRTSTSGVFRGSEALDEQDPFI